MNSFVYCWTDHKTNKLYIGSHKGTEDDGYVCSSKLMLEEYNVRPQDFTRQIVAHGIYEDIRKLEAVLLNAVNAKMDEQFYNQHNGDGNFYLKGHTEKSKRAIGNAHRGKKCPYNYARNALGHTDETKLKLSLNHHDVSGVNNPMYGSSHSEEAKQRISSNRKGKGTRPKTEEEKRKNSEACKQAWARRKGLIHCQ